MSPEVIGTPPAIGNKPRYLVRRWIAWLVMPLAFLGLLHTITGIARRVVQPRAQTFEAFAKAHGQPASLVKTRVRDQTYLIWCGMNWDAPLRMASGPPCYIFDTSGTLVGWSPTTGDGEYKLLLSES